MPQYMVGFKREEPKDIASFLESKGFILQTAESNGAQHFKNRNGVRVVYEQIKGLDAKKDESVQEGSAELAWIPPFCAVARAESPSWRNNTAADDITLRIAEKYASCVRKKVSSDVRC